MNKNVKIAKELVKMAKSLMASGKTNAYIDFSVGSYVMTCASPLGQSSDCTMDSDGFFVTDDVMKAYNSFDCPQDTHLAGLVVKNNKPFAYFKMFAQGEEGRQWLLDKAKELGYEIVVRYDDLFK